MRYAAMAAANGIDPATGQTVAFEIGNKTYADSLQATVLAPLIAQGLDLCVSWGCGESLTMGLRLLSSLQRVDGLAAGLPWRLERSRARPNGDAEPLSLPQLLRRPWCARVRGFVFIVVLAACKVRVVIFVQDRTLSLCGAGRPPPHLTLRRRHRPDLALAAVDGVLHRYSRERPSLLVGA